MKIKINPYIKYLIIENIYYILIAVLLVVSIFVIPSLMLNTYSKNADNISVLEKELQEISSKKNALLFLSSTSSKNIDEYYNLVSSLIPETENYFTIIYSLNNLSESTNFNITSYALNLKESTGNKISIQVTGVGNQQEFLNFLKEYNLGGGRLITAESIKLNSEEFAGITLKLNFYSQKASLSQQGSIDYQKVLNKIDKIKDKIKFNFQSNANEEEIVIEEYPTKTSPF